MRFLKKRCSFKRRLRVPSYVWIAAILIGVFFFVRFLSSEEARFTSVDQSRCDALKLQGTGFASTPVEATILMLFTPAPSTSSTYHYHSKPSKSGVRDTSCDTGLRSTMQRNFDIVSAAFVSEPNKNGDDVSPFYAFFPAHEATFWEVNESGVAQPFFLDVVYTYVNPLAPSMKANLEARGLGHRTLERRYNDWEELRFSLRGLLEFGLNNSIMTHAEGRRDADEEYLRDLGLTVASEDHEDASSHTGRSLIRRVFLVLAHEDQVPEWLNTSLFPQLEVVTHKQMFSAKEESFILPTLNSNAIESGLHRIPDLKNFYLYINNDMFISRQLTIFDMFRPLSPLRQELHFSSMISRSGDRAPDTEWMKNCRISSNRTLVFLEPILHSYGNTDFNMYDGKVDMEEKRSTASQCLKMNAEGVLKQLGSSKSSLGDAAPLLLSSVQNLDSRKTLGFPFPFSVITFYGLGVSVGWYLSVMKNKFIGLGGPMGYAHIPQIYHRPTAHALNEVEVFEWVNKTREAYEREMFSFSTVDVYAGFAISMVKARERYVWTQMMQWSHRHKKNVTLPWGDDIVAYAKENGIFKGTKYNNPKRMSETSVEDCGPLYGTAVDVMLQSPQLIHELSFWWLPSARPDRVPTDSYWYSLKGLYPSIPRVSSTKSGAAHPTLDEHYRLLYQDVRNHLGSDRTFRFTMLEGGVKPLAVLGRLREEEMTHTIPVWLNWNDNYEETGVEEDKLRHGGAFKVIMTIASGRRGPAPWEQEGKK